MSSSATHGSAWRMLAFVAVTAAAVVVIAGASAAGRAAFGAPSAVTAVELTPSAIGVPKAAVQGVDLGIADDRVYGRPTSWSLNQPLKREGMLATVAESRPGVFIAWRNTNLVEQVEVRIRNLGTQPGQAEVFVDVLDEQGKMLIHLDPMPEQKQVTIPPRDQGGEDGKIVRMQAEHNLNRLIDLYDRARIRYDVRATVRTAGATDVNPLDNVKVKSYNIPYRATPGYLHVRNYTFTNTTNEPIMVAEKLESTPLPADWTLNGGAIATKPFLLKPGEKITGFISIGVPDNAKEGDLVEMRRTLVNAKTNAPIGQQEWFLVRDTTPPEMSNLKIIQEDGTIKVTSKASDAGSGILEASGVWLEYSADDGKTFSQKTMAYVDGNFVDPTTFETRIGPFSPATRVRMFITASDTGGNLHREGPFTVDVVKPTTQTTGGQ